MGGKGRWNRLRRHKKRILQLNRTSCRPAQINANGIDNWNVVHSFTGHGRTFPITRNVEINTMRPINYYFLCERAPQSKVQTVFPLLPFLLQPNCTEYVNWNTNKENCLHIFQDPFLSIEPNSLEMCQEQLKPMQSCVCVSKKFVSFGCSAPQCLGRRGWGGGGGVGKSLHVYSFQHDTNPLPHSHMEHIAGFVIRFD